MSHDVLIGPARCRGHGQFPIDNFAASAVIGQVATIVICLWAGLNDITAAEFRSGYDAISAERLGE